jgi:type I site-specific restriction endonuclease
MENKKELLEKIANLEEANARLQKQVNEQTHLVAAIDAKDKEIGTLSERVGGKWQKQVEEKENIIKVLVGHLQSYQQAFRSYLKNVQGGLENAVELEALLSEKLGKK